ncbi:MAG: PorT family protein [Bacteroidales bacterium]|nr:PorT family protein [Bacteroidales bacterium]
MRTNITILLFVLIGYCTTSMAQTKEEKFQAWGPTALNQAGWIVRASYVIGGTSPIPLPNEIRSIDGFKPLGGFSLGADYYQMFSRRWGLQAGVHFFLEGFHTKATVKNYRMGITQGENYLEGNFTGVDETDTQMTGVTIPLTATFRASPRWNISVGPFFTFLSSGTFEGTVYDGYLREGDPTGQKIHITDENPATYDFADDMRQFYWGLQFMFDYKVLAHMNVFGGLDWSMQSIFPSDFETIEFNMYPIYAKIGVAYRY